MAQKISTQSETEEMKIRRAQVEIVACIPEIEKLAQRFLEISRDLDVEDKDEDFGDERPGADHLVWGVAEQALAMNYELLELLPYVRRGAEMTYARLLAEWEARR